MKRLTTTLLCLVAGAAILAPAFAHPAPAMAVQGSATATLTVHAHVVRNCIIQADPLAFGDYDPLVANRTQPLDAQSDIRVTCTRGTTAQVEMDTGSNAQGSARRLSNGNEFLTYEIYKGPPRHTAWGQGPQGMHVASAGFSQSARTTLSNLVYLGAYGRIPGGQNVESGDYDDTVTLTITF